jgi:RsmE family RNA methyltransferase
MNIILFEEHEIGSPFPRDDQRVVHVLEVLRRQIGDSTDVGIVDGPRGKAILKTVGVDEVTFQFTWGDDPEALLSIDLIVGLSRPQTCRKILQEATSLGVRSILFISTDRGEASYATSGLWTTDQWKKLVRAGVEQAFSTRFPRVQFDVGLSDAIECTDPSDKRICLDNYEATIELLQAADGIPAQNSVVLAAGSERGWSARERNLFRQHNFVLAHLGERPLRTETATIAAISVVAAALRSR